MFKNYKLKLLISFVVLFGAAFVCSSSKDDSKKDDTKKEDTKKENIFSADKPFKIKMKVENQDLDKPGFEVRLNYYKYGRRIKVFSEAVMFGKVMESYTYYENELSDTVYTVHKKSSGTTGKMESKKEYTCENCDGMLQSLAAIDIKIKKLPKAGSEVILSLPCDKYSSSDNQYRISVFKNSIPLKVAFGNTEIVAEEIVNDESIDESNMVPPNDIVH
jgi:hypothetical protein